ncbi:hypothetical protein D3C87_2026380 [compost metagenome]
MNDTPARSHAAGRHNDLRHGGTVQRLGRFHIADAGGHAIRSLGVGGRQALVGAVLQIGFHGCAGHRAVKIDGQVCRDATADFQAVQVQQQ